MSPSQKQQGTSVGCACGQVVLELQGDPIVVPECLCSSCREAAGRLAALPGARSVLTPYAATAYAEYRKDRVQFVSGMEHLKEFRLSAQAGSRRVVAACCNTPVFMEMKGAHWLSVYLNLWPDGTQPAVTLRTMVGDLGDASALPGNVLNLKTHNLSFYMKLLGAWIGMGFRNPKVPLFEKIAA